MRYTLRLLTVQQYQRAAALISACELVRLGRVTAPPKAPENLAKGPPISLGLWVGQDSSPNTVKAAIKALATHGPSTPAQAKFCPCCRSPLEWLASPRKDEIWAVCHNASCDLARAMKQAPVWTVDEDVYRACPSLLIGTADKFAQIARNPNTGRLFGIGTDHGPPDLVIQDGASISSLVRWAPWLESTKWRSTNSALWKGQRPKVIGSTATIRRAEEQIRALFDRGTFQFPPPGIDHDNSGFAVADRAAPGRLYVGMTTAGRSAKFTLQAVSASLLQAATDPTLTDVERDPYWELVTSTAFGNSVARSC